MNYAPLLSELEKACRVACPYPFDSLTTQVHQRDGMLVWTVVVKLSAYPFGIHWEHQTRGNYGVDRFPLIVRNWVNFLNRLEGGNDGIYPE